MRIEPWFAQPDSMSGTATLLPGRRGGTDTPLLHWPATLLTQAGWSVLAAVWEEDRSSLLSDREVQSAAEAARARAAEHLPVMVVAKSLGTLAMPWAVDTGTAGVWLTPLLDEARLSTAVAGARQPTLLVGGNADPHWAVPDAVGSGVQIVEVADAHHGLQRAGDWRTSVMEQLSVFGAISRFAADALNGR
ncbi:hypothetical protein [uncultured Friedmanniella sp.]|uniref:hypothetical protein n=1 Tax=uncultured Friedmanniella sp. TaxID=335381 RepID=UPI0035C98933